MNTFDLSQYNKTNFSGLEYSDTNSFMNPLLQMLYLIPPIHYALKTHLSGNDINLSDELGFLYHLLDQSKHLPSKNKSVRICLKIYYSILFLYFIRRKKTIIPNL